jgi:hypothetical protein
LAVHTIPEKETAVGTRIAACHRQAHRCIAQSSEIGNLQIIGEIGDDEMCPLGSLNREGKDVGLSAGELANYARDYP